MFINLTIQMLWITYAPITGPAAKFYGVTDLKIGLLAMTFMIVYIPLSIPVSWAIDTFGFRRTVSIGAVLMGIFGILRGLAGTDYTLVLLATIFIAIAQPFLLNSWTKVPAQWFSIEERATAVGLVTLSCLAGTALGMVLTPLLVQSMSIPKIQLLFGGIAAFSALIFLIFAREKPLTPPCPSGQEVRALMLDGLKHALRVRDFWFYLCVCFIGMGIYNGVTTWVETIIRPRGFTPTDAGTRRVIVGWRVLELWSSRHSPTGSKSARNSSCSGLCLPFPAWLDWRLLKPPGCSLHPPLRWVSSWSAPAQLACNMPPRSPIRPQKAPPMV